MLHNNLFFVFLGKEGSEVRVLFNQFMGTLSSEKVRKTTNDKCFSDNSVPGSSNYKYIDMPKNRLMYEYAHRTTETISGDVISFTTARDIEEGDMFIVSPKELEMLKHSYKGKKHIISVFVDTSLKQRFAVLSVKRSKLTTFLVVLRDWIIYKGINKKVDYVLKSNMGLLEKEGKLMRILQIEETKYS